LTLVILSQRRSAAAPAVSPSAFLSICLSVSLDGSAPRRPRAQCVLGAVLRQRWPCDCLTRQDHPHMGAVHRLLYFHAFGTLGLGPQGTDQRLRGIHGQCLERSGTVSRVECCCTSCAVERHPPSTPFFFSSPKHCLRSVYADVYGTLPGSYRWPVALLSSNGDSQCACGT